jgi:hypothetical protein
MGLGVARVHAQRDSGELLGVAAAAARHQHVDQAVVRPVGACIDGDYRAQRLGRSSEVSFAMLDEVPQLQGLQVARVQLEKRFSRRGRGRHVAALERGACLQDQGMRRGGHFHYSAGFSRACLLPSARAPREARTC